LAARLALAHYHDYRKRSCFLVCYGNFGYAFFPRCIVAYVVIPQYAYYRRIIYGPCGVDRACPADLLHRYLPLYGGYIGFQYVVSGCQIADALVVFRRDDFYDNVQRVKRHGVLYNDFGNSWLHAQYLNRLPVTDYAGDGWIFRIP